MKLGLVGYQGSGKTTLFELLTGVKPDPAKAHWPARDGRRPRSAFRPARGSLQAEESVSPARIELFDTPGLDRKRTKQTLSGSGVIRESNALVLVVGCFCRCRPARGRPELPGRHHPGRFAGCDEPDGPAAQRYSQAAARSGAATGRNCRSGADCRPTERGAVPSPTCRSTRLRTRPPNRSRF